MGPKTTAKSNQTNKARRPEKEIEISRGRYQGRQWNERWRYPDDEKEREILDTWNECDEPLISLSSTELAEHPFDDYIKHFNAQKGDKPDVKGKSTNGVCDWLRTLSLNDLPSKPPQMPLKSPDNEDSSMVPEQQKKQVVYRLVYGKGVGDEKNYKWEVREEASKKIDKKPAQVTTKTAILIDLEEKNETPMAPTHKIPDDLKSLDMDQWHKFFARQTI
ncbi:7422_t:CDS:2 [Dentiscutata erythropus]|uniref:7422_t:CDS:1 n=1 Tax=Dentiscutata erythropus TaxID=1348616 RepID=A0A9N9B182_9GLOM|nr:7422_t:CDS:2 [Dentiscutata erythropus]